MARINQSKIHQVAQALKELPDSGSGLNFYSFRAGKREVVEKDMYPNLYHPSAIDFFFFVCMHQYGFWKSDKGGYVGPIVGTLNGKQIKGSDLIWKEAMRALGADPVIFLPQNLAQLDAEYGLFEIFSDDNGELSFADPNLRYLLTQEYAKWFLKNQTSPEEIVEQANNQSEPLKTFLEILRQVPGYAGDPLEKKSLLLAMALANRPEKFLKVTDPHNWSPIVDYHLMRVSLRLGIVELEPTEVGVNKNRLWVYAETEKEIRQAVYQAVSQLIELSGRPMSFIDEKMWMARKYCPEMAVPNCQECIFTKVCAKQVDLFQPICRTTAY